jgi:cysteinyl-tRNA synthetase
MLKIFNSVTKQKELFKPLVPGQVGIYVCGVTVYDYCHLGHARTYLIFDMIVRYLRYIGYKVKYVRNITDIDDKIINRANANQESCDAVTTRFIDAMYEDEKALNILPPDVAPKATHYVERMVELIQTLIEKGYAYVAENGDVYYDVQKFKSYGCISHRDLDDLLAGARVELNEAKRNALDFVLWKQAKPNEPKWPSPWGEGRPGWHTECSVMSLDELGETFDIHGGGHDLKFPHHENERAQSVAATGKEFVNIWMHVGFLQINKEKMSKSLNNFLTERDFLKAYDAEVLRYFNIASHYRSPVEYGDETIDSAVKGLERLYTALRGLNLENINIPEGTEFEKRFHEAMEDDFNTPVALSVLFELVREINRARETNLALANELGGLLKKLSNVLGLIHRAPEVFLQQVRRRKEIDIKEIETLIALRTQARENKNWAEADKIRAQLTQMGIELEDKGKETLWRQS